MDVAKIIKIVIAVIIGYFALSLVVGVLNIALSILIKVLMVAGLVVLVGYGYKKLKGR